MPPPATLLPPASRSSALPARVLYGREDAQNTLVNAYKETVANDTPAIVFVTGEGGLGKTRFLIETEARLHVVDNQATVAYGRCLAQHSGSNSYQPVREALADLVFEAKRKNKQNLLSRVSRVARTTAPDWLEAVPAVGSLLKAATKTVAATIEEARPRNIENSATRQFCDLVMELLAEGPLVLCLDDLHWADTSTVDLVYALTQSIRTGPFVLVCAFREADLQLSSDRTHPLLDTIYRIERYCTVTRVALKHLSSEQLTLLVEDVVGKSPPSRLITTLIKLTSGNPLFVQEYLGLLMDTLGKDASPSRVDESLSAIDSAGPPRRVEALIEERLGRLTAEEVRTLEVASLIGPVFEPDILMAVLDIDQSSARSALRSLCRRHALLNAVPQTDGVPRYAFHHATVAQVLEARLRRIDPFDYQEIHRSIADHLRSSTTRDLALLERLAHHSLASGDVDAALKAALNAANAAWLLGGVKEALRFLKAATTDSAASWEFPKIFAEAATLRLKAANAVADHEDAINFGRSLFASSQISRELDATASLAVARALRMTNRWGEASATLTHLANSGDRSEVRAEALLLLGQVQFCGSPPRFAQALETLALAESMDPPVHIKYQIVGHIGLAKLSSSDLPGAFDALEQSISLAANTAQPFDKYEALHWRSKAEIACLNLVDATRTLDELELISDTAGVASSVPFHLRDRGRVLALQGRPTSSAVAYSRYLETVAQLTSPMQFRRGLATIAFQCLELAQLGNVGDATILKNSIVEPLKDTWIDQQYCHLIIQIFELSLGVTSIKELTTSLANAGVLYASELEAVDSIYRFDIPDLANFRARNRRSIS